MGVTHAHASAPARLAACPEGADRAHGLEGLELGLADAVAVADELAPREVQRAARVGVGHADHHDGPACARGGRTLRRRVPRRHPGRAVAWKGGASPRAAGRGGPRS